MADLSRRGVLPIAAAALAGTAIPVIAAEPSGLATLVETHRTAKAAFETACDRLESLDEAFNEAEPIVTIPCLLGDEQSTILITSYRDEVRDQITERYTNWRLSLERLACRLAPGAVDHVLALLEAKRTENIGLLEAAFAEEDARKEALGLTAAQREYERTNDAEKAALQALCAFECSTLAEARAKAAYLIHLDILGYDAEFIEALLRSFIGGGNNV